MNMRIFPSNAIRNFVFYRTTLMYRDAIVLHASSGQVRAALPPQRAHHTRRPPPASLSLSHFCNALWQMMSLSLSPQNILAFSSVAHLIRDLYSNEEINWLVFEAHCLQTISQDHLSATDTATLENDYCMVLLTLFDQLATASPLQLKNMAALAEKYTQHLLYQQAGALLATLLPADQPMTSLLTLFEALSHIDLHLSLSLITTTALTDAILQSFIKDKLSLTPAQAAIFLLQLQTRTHLSVLHYAAQHQYHEMMTILLQQNPDLINLQDHHGRTLLMLACHANQALRTKEYLQRGADINVQDKYGLSALMYACQGHNSTLASSLLAWGADVNLRDKMNMTALMYACWLGSPTNIEAVLHAHPDINVQNAHGFNALMYATLQGHEHVVQTLLHLGAQADTQNLAGRDAYAFSRQNKQPLIQKLLRPNWIARIASFLRHL